MLQHRGGIWFFGLAVMLFAASAFAETMPIRKPLFIIISFDDAQGGSGRAGQEDNNGMDFLTKVIQEIKDYALSKNPDVEPPKVVWSFFANPRQAENVNQWNRAGNEISKKWKTLFDLGCQFANHGFAHQCMDTDGNGINERLGALSPFYQLYELKGSLDYYRFMLPGYHRGILGFRPGGGEKEGSSWNETVSPIARDIDCFRAGFGGRAWPREESLDGFRYWYVGSGSHALSPKLNPGSILGKDLDVQATTDSWIKVFDGASGGGSAVTVTFHDYDLSAADKRQTIAQAEQRRDVMRGFLKHVLVDQNKKYNPYGKYENVYCITYNQYLEYYWLTRKAPESNYSSVEEILAAGNMHTVKYSAPVTIEAENMRQKQGGATREGWVLTAGSFIADVVNFPEPNATYTVHLVAKATRGSGGWPRVQVRMGAMVNRLCKLKEDHEKYFSAVGTVKVASSKWDTHKGYVSFPIKVGDKNVYALANVVILQLDNPRGGGKVYIDKVGFTLATKIFQQGRDGYAGTRDMYFSGSSRATSDKSLVFTTNSKISLGFDISSVPKDAVISRAHAGLWCYGTSAGFRIKKTDLGTIEAYKASTDGGPETTGAVLDSKKIVSEALWYEFDVTSLVQSAISDEGKSVNIVLTGDSGGKWKFSSSRFADVKRRPKLKITYSAAGADGDKMPAAAETGQGVKAGGDESETEQPTDYAVRRKATAEKLFEKAKKFAEENETVRAVDLLKRITITYRGTEAAGKAADLLAKLETSDDVQKAASERKAKSRLSMARNYARAGQKEKALEYCKEVLAKYPGTYSAEKAAELIKELER